MSLVVAAIMACCTARATAEPRTFHCKTSGATRAGFGNLVLTVDLDRRTVRVEMPKCPGYVSEYQDGRFGQIYIQVPEGRAAFSESVAQFVNVRRNAIEVGYRSAEGSLMHLARFNRAAPR